MTSNFVVSYVFPKTSEVDTHRQVTTNNCRLQHEWTTAPFPAAREATATNDRKKKKKYTTHTHTHSTRTSTRYWWMIALPRTDSWFWWKLKTV